MLGRFLRKPVVAAFIVALSVAGGLWAAAAAFKDPLDSRAGKVVRQIASTPLQGVTWAGHRLVAVGIRGLIIFSDDGGKTWIQASAPVASDLLDVCFPTIKDGWAVGHDGVVLHTRDGGSTWEEQLDGRMTQKLLTEHFQSHINAGNAEAERYLRDTQLNYATGPEQALLSVWFEDAQHGFVAGTFGTLLATQDGGATWESWVERVDSDMPLHYFAVRGTRKGVLLSSEKGTIFRLDAARQRFVPMATGYNGSLNALVETDDAVLALGLQGNIYRLAGDADTWERVQSGTTANFTAGASLPDGGALLVTQAGQLLATRDNGGRLKPVPLPRPMLFTGVTAADAHSAVVVGLGGVSRVPLQ